MLCSTLVPCAGLGKIASLLEVRDRHDDSGPGNNADNDVIVGSGTEQLLCKIFHCLVEWTSWVHLCRRPKRKPKLYDSSISERLKRKHPSTRCYLVARALALLLRQTRQPASIHSGDCMITTLRIRARALCPFFIDLWDSSN